MHSLHKLCLRVFLVLTLVTGLLAPRMTAVVAEIMPGVQTMVICTGQGLVTLTIGADGKPIEVVEAEPHNCVLADSLVLAANAPAFWEKLAGDYRLRFAIRESERSFADPLNRRSPTRGPPDIDLI